MRVKVHAFQFLARMLLNCERVTGQVAEMQLYTDLFQFELIR